MKTLRPVLLILVLGLLLCLPFLGSVRLLDWDELNFAQAAREMIQRGDYLQVTIGDRPFHEKPPLFFWLQSLSFHSFGSGATAARLPSALSTILTALLLFAMGKQIRGRRFGLSWALFFLGSLLPLFVGRMGLIDPVFNLLMALGLFALFLMDATPSRALALAGGAALGLAVITKGPLGAAIPLAVFFIYRLGVRDGRLHLRSWLFFLGGLLFAGGLWFALETAAHGPGFVREFVVYQMRLLRTGDAGHGGFVGYEILLFLLGCFPLSVFALRGLFRKRDQGSFGRFSLLARIWLLLVLGLFMLVKTKIPHYTSFAYMPGAFLAALELERLRSGKGASAVTMILWVLAALLISFLFLLLPWLGANPDRWTHLVADINARASLARPLAWPPLTWLPGLLMALGSVASLVLALRRRVLPAARLQLATTALTVLLAWPLLLPRVEFYSQGDAVELYLSLREEPVDVCIYGFKSYAHLYYLERRAWSAMNAEGRQRLAAQTERPLYIVAPLSRADEVAAKWPIREAGRCGAYVLLEKLGSSSAP